MNKLVIISWINYEQRINDLFCVDRLLENGVELEYWDVSNFTFYEHAICDNVPSKLKVRTLHNIKEFELSVIAAGLQPLYVCYMNYCKESYGCYRVLTKYNANIAYCINGCQPSFVESKKDRTLRRLKSFLIQPKKFIRLFEDRWYTFLQKTALIKSVDYLFVTCNKASSLNVCKTDNNTRIVKYNSTNYQQAFQDNTINPESSKRYIVFLDEYMPFHPYVQETAGSDWINPDEYFTLINKYFCEIEKKYSCKVVIAAHPIAMKYKTHNYFEGRSIYFGYTNVLVKNSIGVITHNSTSINYAVIWKKPIIIIADKFTQPESSVILSRSYAKRLNAIMLSSIEDRLDDCLHIDEEEFDTFKYDYMTNRETENVSNSEILLKLFSGGN